MNFIFKVIIAEFIFANLFRILGVYLTILLFAVIIIFGWPIFGPMFGWAFALLFAIVGNSILFLLMLGLMVIRMACGMSNNGIMSSIDWASVSDMYHMLGN